MIVQKKSQVVNFFPGDEWVYFKIYGGAKNANKVLLTAIDPISKRLLNEKIIDQWFFIRYKDPEDHLRVRFHITQKAHFALLISMIRERLDPMISSKIIWKLVVDTYQREIDRYGFEEMELSESLFYINSEIALDLLKRYRNDLDFFACCLLLVERMLAILNKDQKKIFLEIMKINFHQEFNVKTATKRSLASRFNDYQIEKLAYADFEFREDLVLEQDRMLKNCLQKTKNESNIDDFQSLLSSFIHMAINRFFHTNQRMFELLIYDFMVQRFNKGR